MPEPELQALADDIKKNGQTDPIIYIIEADPNDLDGDGKVVIDGRNRLLACKLAGIKPMFENAYDVCYQDPIAFVLSKNLHRRHLTAEQRAAIVLQAEELSGALAKAQADAKVRDPKVRASREAPGGKTAAVIAEKAKVSRATVERVQAASKDNPEVLDDIAKGKTTSAKVRAATAKPKPTAKPTQDIYQDIALVLDTVTLKEPRSNAKSAVAKTWDIYADALYYFEKKKNSETWRTLVEAARAYREAVEPTPEPPKPPKGIRVRYTEASA